MQHVLASILLALLPSEVPVPQALVPREELTTPGEEFALPPEETAPARFTGRAVLPDGRPVEGAVVVTSAGGKAVSGEDGSFELEVLVPLSAQRLHLTAVAGSGGSSGSLLASAVLSAPFGEASAGELVLESSASCSPDWIPTFGEMPGVQNLVRAMAVFDDGSGPALFVAGPFNGAGSTPATNFAKWDGARWSDVGVSVSTFVFDLLAFDDGSGPALYVAGQFNTIAGIPARGIARWDGTSWSALGTGTAGAVTCLAAFDDGSGPALHAAGSFTTMGGQPASNIAKWNGASWSALQGGLDGQVFSLCVYDDGTGSTLFAGGSFNHADGSPASRIARWDGSSWSDVGGGVDLVVRSLAVFDSGSGPRLIAGGGFTQAGGVAASRIAAWDGSSWDALGSGVNATVHTLLARQVPGGPRLYVGGAFTTAGGASAPRIARWDGSNWSAMDDGVDNTVMAMAVLPSASGDWLYIGGSFSRSGERATRGIARWDGTSWRSLGTSVSAPVHALHTLPAQGGTSLIVGGDFISADDLVMKAVGKWDSEGWSPLGSGIGGAGTPSVRALAVQDLGHGLELFVAGIFSSAGGAPASNIASWRAGQWMPLGDGLVGGHIQGVHALLAHDDGSGPSLFAAGGFQTSGALNLFHVARWGGANWWWMGTGTNLPAYSLAHFDDGNGPVLYAGGSFSSASGVPASKIAKWDGASWSPLGDGICCGQASVDAMIVHDDGSGPALYVGGSFSWAGEVVPGTNHIARWNGTSWSSVGGGMNSRVTALAVHDDGRGPALYAGGQFTVAGGMAANRIAKWNGQQWLPLGAGVSLGSAPPGVRSLVVHDTGQGPELYLGGTFQSSPGGDSYLARWGGCAGVGTAYCFGVESACPCANAGRPGQGCANSTGVGATIQGSGSASVALDNLSIAGGELPPGRPVLLFSGSNATNGGQGIALGDGLRCAGGNERRLTQRMASAQGIANWGPGIASLGGYTAGQTVRFQLWYRDPQGSPCGALFNLSHGLEVVFTP
jgi:hypothetical protein